MSSDSIIVEQTLRIGCKFGIQTGVSVRRQRRHVAAGKWESMAGTHVPRAVGDPYKLCAILILGLLRNARKGIASGIESD